MVNDVVFSLPFSFEHDDFAQIITEVTERHHEAELSGVKL